MVRRGTGKGDWVQGGGGKKKGKGKEKGEKEGKGQGKGKAEGEGEGGERARGKRQEARGARREARGAKDAPRWGSPAAGAAWRSYQADEAEHSSGREKGSWSSREGRVAGGPYGNPRVSGVGPGGGACRSTMAGSPLRGGPTGTVPGLVADDLGAVRRPSLSGPPPRHPSRTHRRLRSGGRPGLALPMLSSTRPGRSGSRDPGIPGACPPPPQSSCRTRDVGPSSGSSLPSPAPGPEGRTDGMALHSTALQCTALLRALGKDHTPRKVLYPTEEEDVSRTRPRTPDPAPHHHGGRRCNVFGAVG
ncbi:hypothetical protein JHW43_002980 [Diplocarpon mali]|nr:hypothetical protein JHW43_002980 [Diplocarpon mali]